MADVINVVPKVAGRITELHVVDNQALKQGELLFVIDPRAYEYAVAHGRADVEALDAEIALTQRRIEGQEYATAAARAAVQRAEAQAEGRRCVQPSGAAGAAGVRHRRNASIRPGPRSGRWRRASTRPGDG
jgi:multidrug resistance efflux pump